MKHLLILLIAASAIFSAQAQKGDQFRRDKDSAVKYFRLFFSSPDDWKLAVEKYYYWRSVCLAACHNKVDSNKFMNDMVDSAGKQIHPVQSDTLLEKRVYNQSFLPIYDRFSYYRVVFFRK
jgi:hypothetical protein